MPKRHEECPIHMSLCFKQLSIIHCIISTIYSSFFAIGAKKENNNVVEQHPV